MNPKISNTTKSGFTIVELIVVIVVIAVLASITLVSYRYLQTRAADTATASSVKQYVDALEMYAFEHGRYPVASSCLGVKPAGVDRCGTLQYEGNCSEYGVEDYSPIGGIDWDDSFIKSLSKYMGEGVKNPQYYPFKSIQASAGDCRLYYVADYPVYQSYKHIEMHDGVPWGTYSSADVNYSSYIITYAPSSKGTGCGLSNSVKDGDICYVWDGKIED